MKDHRMAPVMKNNHWMALFWILAVAMPAGAMIEALSMSAVWRWLLSAQYGAGPSLGSWFGISSIVSFLTDHLTAASRRSNGQAATPPSFAEVVYRSFARWVTVGISVAVVFVVGAMFGWIR